MRYDVIVVGAGASGLMAAITAARKGCRVLVIEHKDKAGKKILATGNGKCNYTNQDQKLDHYRSTDPQFVASVLDQFGFEETIQFFEELGILPKERNGYYYPHSEQASSMVQVLLMECDRLQIKLNYDEKVRQIKQKSEYNLDVLTQSVIDKSNQRYNTTHCILASGGCASPKLGSDGSGFIISKDLGHGLIKTLPALVQLKSSDKYCKTISGVRTQGQITLFTIEKTSKKEIPLSKEYGELVFTDYGISGIPVLQISRYAAIALNHGERLKLGIDFLTEFSYEQLIKFITNRIKTNPHKNLEEMMVGLLNHKLNYAILKEVKLDPYLSCDMINHSQILQLCKFIKFFPMNIVGTNSFDQAQVSTGGIPCNEIHGGTLESKLVKGLHFCGEIIDVDGTCGGYNLQWAWSSGYVAGNACCSS